MVALSLPGAPRLEEPLSRPAARRAARRPRAEPLRGDRDPRGPAPPRRRPPRRRRLAPGDRDRPRRMTHPSCAACPEPAVYLDRASGEHLCGDHLSARVEATFRATLRAPGGLHGGERVAVAFSGGKDSSVLLHLLATIAAPELDLTLVAVTIDEGIAGYRDETIAGRAGARGPARGRAPGGRVPGGLRHRPRRPARRTRAPGLHGLRRAPPPAPPAGRAASSARTGSRPATASTTRPSRS